MQGTGMVGSWCFAGDGMRSDLCSMRGHGSINAFFFGKIAILQKHREKEDLSVHSLAPGAQGFREVTHAKEGYGQL